MSLSATLSRGDRARIAGPGSGSIRLLEHFATAEPNIDRKAGVMYRVKILGRESANRRTYSDQAMRDAAQLYEGAAVHFDHDREQPNRERKTVENFGILRGPMTVVTSGPIESQGVFGNLHYLTTHARAAEVLERIDKKMPIGLSHNADGNGRRSGERFIVESIAKVNSVDLVLNPATSKSLFESRNQPHYGGRAAMVAALRSGRTFHESNVDPDMGDHVAGSSQDVDAAVDAALYELLPADNVAELRRKGAESIKRSYETAASYVTRTEGMSPAEKKAVLAKLIDTQKKAIDAFDAILAPLDNPPLINPDDVPVLSASSKDRESVVESVWQELQAKRAGKYPADVKQMAAALRR